MSSLGVAGPIIAAGSSGWPLWASIPLVVIVGATFAWTTWAVWTHRHD